MFFYIISPPYDTENFNENIFRKIVNIIPVKFFQFRPKHKELDNREKFVKKFARPGSQTLYTLLSKNEVPLLALFPSNENFEVGEKVPIRFAVDHVVAYPL